MYFRNKRHNHTGLAAFNLGLSNHRVFRKHKDLTRKYGFWYWLTHGWGLHNVRIRKGKNPHKL